MRTNFFQRFCMRTLTLGALSTAALLAGCSAGPGEPVDEASAAASSEALSFPFNLHFYGWNHAWDKPAPSTTFVPNLTTGSTFGTFAAWQDSPTSAQLFWSDKTGLVRHLWPNGAGWGLEKLAGATLNGVAAARAPGGGTYIVAGTSPDQHTHVKMWMNGQWGSWIDIGGLASQPRPAVVIPNGVPHVFTVGTDGKLYQHQGIGSDASLWAYQWEALPPIPDGHKIVDSPVATGRGADAKSNHADVVVVTDNGGLWHLDYQLSTGVLSENGVGTWEKINTVGPVNGPLALTARSSTNLSVFASRGGLMDAYEWSPSSGWTRSILQPAQCHTGPIQATSASDGSMNLYVAQPDGNVYHNMYSANYSTTTGANVCDGYCGLSGEKCCGSQCTVGGGANAAEGDGSIQYFTPLVCDAQTKCSYCGGRGEACCPDSSCRAPGTACDGSNHCNDAPTPPTNPNPPNNPNPPQQPPCGGLGQQCCGGTKCNAPSLVCEPGGLGGTTCASCGSNGEQCCPNATCFQPQPADPNGYEVCGNYQNPIGSPGQCEMFYPNQ